MSNVNQQSMLPIGTVVGGRYRIVRYLSSGGFGNTYEAEHTDLGNRCAIKEYFVDGMTHRGDNGLSVEVSNTQNLNIYNSQLDKFRQEAQLLNKMQHPGIVRVHDLFVDNQTAYYAMDIIDGQSLAAILKQNGPLSEQQALRYISQVLDALAYVHSRGLLHLDIKPGNIMIDRATDRAVLIDFGATKQFDRSSTGFSSTAPAFTKGYAPPEQINYNKVKIGPWTDLYALGATLFTLTTGEFPPLSDDITDYEDAAFRFAADATPAFRQLVVWLMQQPTKRRPQSVPEVLPHLSQLIEKRDGIPLPLYIGEAGVAPTQYELGQSSAGIDEKRETSTELETIEVASGTEANNASKPQKQKWLIVLFALIGIVVIGSIIISRWANKENDNSQYAELDSAALSSENQLDKAIYKTFTEMAELQIGDYVYSDGSFSHEGPSTDKTCIGMVFSLKTTATEKKKGWTHGQMVALKDAGDCAWSDDEVDFPFPHKNVVTQLWTDRMISEIRNDKDGYVYSSSKYTNNCPAFKAARNYKVSIPFASSGWYIPSIGQWCDILENICGFQLKRNPEDYIEVMLVGENKSYIKFDTSAYEYWSSSDRSKYYVWVYKPSGFESGGLTSGRKGMGGKVRAVAAF